MKRILVLLFLLTSHFLKAQDHAIGLGTGLSSLGIPPVNLNYQFSYKVLNTKAKITYFPIGLYVSGDIFTNDYFIGIKTKEDKPVIISFNAGGSYLFYLTQTPNSDISDQVNPVVNLNIYTALNQNHRLTTDFTFSKYSYLYPSRSRSRVVSSLYISIEVGYAYRFKKKKKAS